MSQTRLHILTQAEINTLYSPPFFSDEERASYFSLNDAEYRFMRSLGSRASQVYCVLQLGYFKATTQFFATRWMENQGDIRFITRLFFKKENDTISAPSDKTRKKIHDHILILTGFNGNKQTILQNIEAVLIQKIRLNVNPHFLFYEIITDLQEKKQMLPAYSTLQKCITSAILREQNRLSTTLSTHLTDSIATALETLLTSENSLSFITALKKEPKNFTTSEIKIEIQKLENNKMLYQFSKRFFMIVKITPQAIQYYSSLVIHYSIDRLRELPKRLTQVYLLCYIYHRYQQTNDNLITAFLYLTDNYYQAAKRLAKESIVDKKIPVNEDSKQATKVLSFYVDKTISDRTAFGKIRKKAFRLLEESKFSAVIQFLSGVLFDFDEVCWNHIASLKTKFALNIRPIFKALTFDCCEKNVNLSQAIFFLKNHFVTKKSNHDEIPLKAIPAKRRVYLKEKDQKKMDIHRYEFMVYLLIREHLESGEVFINESVCYKDFRQYLVSDQQWKNKQTLLKKIGYEKLLTPIEELLQHHQSYLDNLLVSVNTRIDNGENSDISVKNKGNEITWTLPYQKQEEKPNHPLFQELPKISIADLLCFVDKECEFIKKFTHIKPHHAKSQLDTTAIIACLIANGTHLGIYKMAENCNLNYDRMQTQLRNFIRSETLQTANNAIINAIADLPIFRHWDIHEQRLHGSVDGQKFGTRLQNFMARYSSKYFGVDKGVVSYTLSLNHVPTNAKIITANQHESHFLFDIVYNNSSNIDPDWVSGDTHAVNQINFLLLDLINKQFAPHLKRIQMKAQKLYSFSSMEKYKNNLIKPTNQIKTDLIKSEWDNMLRIFVSLLLGETSQQIIVSKLSSYKRNNRTKLALWEFDHILRSEYLLNYINDISIRQNVRRSLNRGEAYHQLRRAIAVNSNKFRGTNAMELEVWNESARLLANAIIYYNARLLCVLLNKFEKQGNTHMIKKLGRVSPVAWLHINLAGHYEFTEDSPNIDIDQLSNNLNTAILAL